MNMRINIILANKEDLSQIVQLQKECYQSEAEIYNDFYIPPLQQDIYALENEYTKCTFLKAVFGEEIVGSVRGFSDGATYFVGKLIVKKIAIGLLCN